MTVRINEEAATIGYIQVFCRVGAPPSFNGSAEATATARVPGGVDPRVVGYLKVFRYKPQLGMPQGDPLPGIKVYLRSPLTGNIGARAVTDDTGRLTFLNVPVDRYDFVVVGPWEIVWPDTRFDVRKGETGAELQWHYIFVKPGPFRPDPEPQQPADQLTTPVPPPSGTQQQPPEDTGLAWTGTNVFWLALGGLVAFVAGAGLILYSRGRRSH